LVGYASAQHLQEGTPACITIKQGKQSTIFSTAHPWMVN